MIRSIINILNPFFFKKSRVVISVFPNFEDNGVALANFLDVNYDIPIFFVNSTDRYSRFIEGNSKVKVLPPRTIKSIYYLLTSKFIFFTHGLVLNRPSKKQIFFNIWHGYGYKPVGILIGHKGVYADYTASTSDDCQKVFSKMFGVPLSSVVNTGFPRNDRLFGFDRNSILNQLGVDTSKFVFFWLPTYRKSVIGEVRTDGVDVGNPFGTKDFDVIRFNAFLQESNAVCIVKPHPMAARYEQDSSFSNIVFIDDNQLHDKGLTLYPLLGVTDCLISDLSSVIIDYVLVDKPIICFVEDAKEYRETRGVLYDNLEEMIPGPMAQNTSEFYTLLKEVVVARDLLPEKRRKLRDFFHHYIDQNSARRVVETVLDNKFKAMAKN